jgi:sortase A
MKSKSKKKTFIILGCCCLAAAIALAAYNVFLTYRAGVTSSQLSDMLEKASATNLEDGEDALLKEQADNGEMKTKTVNGVELVGQIALPTQGINLAVISEWSYPNLQISACRYSGSPSGQLVILAHNYDTHFGRLKYLKPGDAVTFTDVSGRVYNYVVTGTEIKGKYELNDILSGDWDMTLFTCTIGGKNRVVVRCDLADS